MIHIALHLHAYQPPTQPQRVLIRIFQESYEPVIAAIENNPHAFISLDIARSLGERLPVEFLLRIRAMIRARKIELVNTAAYHYLLPLVPKSVMKRQLELNLQFYREHLIDEGARVPGVFPPELACSPYMPGYLREWGYEWMMADDGPYVYSRATTSAYERVPLKWILSTEKCGVLLRSRLWSETIARMNAYPRGADFADAFIKSHIHWRNQIDNIHDSYCVLACDFETFGHHHPGTVQDFLIPFFDAMAARPTMWRISSLDAIFNHFPRQERPGALPFGSWVTTGGDIMSRTYFPLWNNPVNRFHYLWNEFFGFLFDYDNLPANNEELSGLLDRAFYSCTPWQYAKGNKEVARWCLPMFRRIAEILASLPYTAKLRLLSDEMERLTA